MQRSISITLTIAMAMALTVGAQAQSITWTEKGGSVGSGNWFIPKVASDGSQSLVVIGQNGTGLVPLEYQTGVYPNYATSINWNATDNSYTAGEAPSVAMNVDPYYDDIAVEVHQGGQNNGAALWSHIAQTTGEFGSTIPWNSGDEYDTGYNPTVAMDPFWTGLGGSTSVVEVHQAGKNLSNLWYHVGTLAYDSSFNLTLTWGPAYQFDYGYVPSVSMCGGVAVEVHEGNPGTLWYSVGTVSGNKVNWSASTQYDSGYNPSVSATCNPGTLVEVHQGQNPGVGKSSKLWYHVAPYSSSGVSWTPAKEYDTGCYPTATIFYGYMISDSGWVGETHTEVCGKASALDYDLGTLIP